VDKKKTDWNKVKTDYLKGLSREEICKKYGLNYKTLDTRINSHKWIDEARKIKGKSKEKLQEKLSETLADRQAQAIQMQESDFLKLVGRCKVVIDTAEIDDLSSIANVLDKSYKNIRQALNIRDTATDLNVTVHKKKTPAEIDAEIAREFLKEIEEIKNKK
jgi:hypothetical protein